MNEYARTVAGIEPQQLAEQVGDLHYEALSEFLNALCFKIARDYKRDSDAGKPHLASQLKTLAVDLRRAGLSATDVWETCRPHM